MYILDTNTLIYFFKGVGNVAEKLLGISPSKIGIPAIVFRAATAISRQGTLVTNNTKEFKRIPKLKIENWL